jgi:hypothetical protein
MVERKRAFDAAEQERLLSALRDARRALVRAAESMPRRSVTRAGTDLIVTNIDDLAQLLTGSREHFWEPPHATPGE